MDESLSATTVLLVGTAQPAAHAVARSLARAGHRVIGTRENARLAGRTRYCARTHVLPPAAARDEFLAAIDAVCAREGVEVVVPLADETLGALLRGRGADADWRLVGPNREVFDLLSDKEHLSATALRAGLAAPREAVAGPAQPLAELPPLPAYVKIVSGAADGRAAGRPVRVLTEAACRAAVERVVETGRSAVVQEEVSGPQWRFHFARRGSVVRHVAARTVANYPLRTGQSTVSLFGPTPPAVAAAATALLDEAEYDGIGSIQLILRDGLAYAHDANLRMPASVAGTVAAGLDLPRLGVEIARGGRPPTAPADVRSLRFVQLDGELAALRDAVRGREVGRGPFTIAKEIALGVLLPARVAEPFDVRDPLPTLAAAAAAVHAGRRSRSSPARAGRP
jgi:predicted ATP-grasp superfamily ATP-dependent carboligase